MFNKKLFKLIYLFNTQGTSNKRFKNISKFSPMLYLLFFILITGYFTFIYSSTTKYTFNLSGKNELQAGILAFNSSYQIPMIVIINTILPIIIFAIRRRELFENFFSLPVKKETILSYSFLSVVLIPVAISISSIVGYLIYNLFLSDFHDKAYAIKAFVFQISTVLILLSTLVIFVSLLVMNKFTSKYYKFIIQFIQAASIIFALAQYYLRIINFSPLYNFLTDSSFSNIIIIFTTFILSLVLIYVARNTYIKSSSINIISKKKKFSGFSNLSYNKNFSWLKFDWKVSSGITRLFTGYLFIYIIQTVLLVLTFIYRKEVIDFVYILTKNIPGSEGLLFLVGFIYCFATIIFAQITILPFSKLGSLFESIKIAPIDTRKLFISKLIMGSMHNLIIPIINIILIFILEIVELNYYSFKLLNVINGLFTGTILVNSIFILLDTFFLKVNWKDQNELIRSPIVIFGPQAVMFSLIGMGYLIFQLKYNAFNWSLPKVLILHVVAYLISLTTMYIAYKKTYELFNKGL